jgi:hypothetical protein
MNLYKMSQVIFRNVQLSGHCEKAPLMLRGNSDGGVASREGPIPNFGSKIRSNVLYNSAFKELKIV